MRCILCYKTFDYALGFKDLGYFNFICKECKNLIEPKLVIAPIDHGYLIFYYYFLLNDEYENNLNKRINKTIIDIINQNKKMTIMFLDDENIKYLKYINFCQNILLISTVYQDLSILENED